MTYQGIGTAPYRAAGTTRAADHALFGQTMGYVAITTGIFALGAYLGRDLSAGVGLVAFIAAFAVLIGMRFAVARSRELALALLGTLGLLLGLAVAPTIAYYASMDPRAVWDAGGSMLA
jgi:modulator of FtsH protease